jgi:hypothetical protein
MSFTVRPLEERETMGTKLNQMRRRLAISLDMAAASTHIQRRHIESLEHDDHSGLPEPLYTRNYIKTYVKFLGGDVGYFLKRYEEERGTCDVLVNPMRLPRQRVGWTKLLAAHRLFKIGIVAILCLAIATYIGLQIQSIITPPDIILFEPADGIAITEARVVVSGQIDERTEVWVNEIKVLPDQSGNFSTLVDLERGLNVITIEGAKRYSKKAILYRTVVFESSE